MGSPVHDSSRGLERSGPAYLRIGAELRRRIADGTYPPDSPLPPQRQLSDDFGVTVMTLRQALEALKQEHLVVTRHGSGTFVAPGRFNYSVGPLRSLAHEMASQGRAVRTRVLRHTRAPAEPGVATALALAVGAPAVCLERLRFVDGEQTPSVYQRSTLSGHLWEILERSELEHSSLYDLLDRHAHLDVERATERLLPTLLDADTAALLGRSAGDPALLSERLSFMADDQPVLHDLAFIPGDRLVITADRSRTDVSMRFELFDPAATPPRRQRGNGGERTCSSP